MAQFETISESIFKKPRRRDFNNNLAYSSNNYLILIGTINVIVNNNKIGNKISAGFLLIPNKYITFATDKGTFTAAATKHGMGVQEFAARVLRNKEDYSPSLVKKANFARNASKWH